jgi:hypothetical protein
VNCPICGFLATRINERYWCTNDKIYLGGNFSVEAPITTPQPQSIEKSYESAKTSKFFNKLIWVVIGVLYAVVMILVVWSLLSGNFDTGSIYS